MSAQAPRFSRLAGWMALGYAIVLAAIWLGISSWSSLSSVGPGLDEPAVREAFAGLSASRAGKAGEAAEAEAPVRGVASLYCAGKIVSSVTVRFDRQGHLVGPGFANDPALRAISPDSQKPCRVKLDIFRGRGSVASTVEPLFAVSLVAGRDGLGAAFDPTSPGGAREVLILPDELLAEGLLAGNKPLPDLDFEVGLDVRAALRLLASRAGLDATAWRRSPPRLFRFRTDGYVQPASGSGAPLPVLRANPPAPALDEGALLSASMAGARYLALHLSAEGRFDYEYDTVIDQAIPAEGSYSLPRHAGAALFLASAAARDRAFAEPAARAVGYLVANRPDGCDRPDLACVGRADDATVDLGSSALALIATAEYERTTGDTRFHPWARRAAAFILLMQKADGDFCHLYDVAAARRDEKTRLLYYSGEAAFALTRFALVDSEMHDRLATAADRALAWLTGPAYGYFAGGFFYGEDHWTCIAAEDAQSMVPTDHGEAYAKFCEGFARFLSRTRFSAGEGALVEQPDLLGAYGFTPLIVPHPTPVGSRTEALIAIHSMAVRHHHDAEARRLEGEIKEGLRFLLAHQVRPDGAYLMRNPTAADGGFLMSDVARFVRIDFVQHACSGMQKAAADPVLRR